MATSEIEKLERRYAENPHGLTFAPLAEVHRKNGDVARALELLTAGLELHPNYIPASIVLGRCHQDLGDLAAAEAAFAHVLRLDDENVIALKSLADINERLERLDDAEAWLRRLVSVDRSNDEAREELRRLEALKTGAKSEEKGRDRPKRPSSEVVALDLPPVDIAALDLPEPKPAPPPKPEVAPPKEPARAAPLVLERTPELVEGAPEVPSITDRPKPAPAERVTPMPGLISQEFEPPKDPVRTSGEFLIDVETSHEVVLEGSGGAEYRVPDAAEEFREAAAAWSPTRPPERVPRAPAEPPGRQSYVATDTKGQSVASFFRAILAARPPADGGTPTGDSQSASGEGASTRPPQDGLSLSPVGGGSSPALPGGAGPEPKADAGVSFDDFFGSKGEESAGGQGAEPGKDDLDQFQTWLQNLKR